MTANGSVFHGNEIECLSWKPIIAGALIAIGLSFILNLFSVAIGLSAFTADNEGVQTLVFGGLLATSIGIIACMFASGWLTGYLAQRHCSKRNIGAIYGFLAWCVALVITIFIAAHVQEYVSFYARFLSGSTDVIQVSHTAATASSVATTTADMQTKHLVISTYIVFCLFFLSAFACSFGGHCGMRYTCKNPGSC